METRPEWDRVAPTPQLLARWPAGRLTGRPTRGPGGITGRRHTGGGTVGAADGETGAEAAGAGAVTVTTTTGCDWRRGLSSTPPGFGLALATSSTPNQTDANTTVAARPAMSQRAMNASAAPSGGMNGVAATTAGTASGG